MKKQCGQRNPYYRFNVHHPIQYDYDAFDLITSRF